MTSAVYEAIEIEKPGGGFILGNSDSFSYCFIDSLALVYSSIGFLPKTTGKMSKEDKFGR
jgi:hypothetical protein